MLYRKKERERESDTYRKTKQLYRHLKNGLQVTDLIGKRKTVHCTELITNKNVDLTLKNVIHCLKYNSRLLNSYFKEILSVLN